MKKKVLAFVFAITALACVGLSACNKQEVDMLFGKELTTLTSQLDILTQINNGSADIGVMDSIMAKYYMTTGTYASTMQILEGFDLAEEEYGIAAKKGNKALMSKINEALIALTTDGKVSEIADEFGLSSELLIESDAVDPYADATDDSWTKLVASKKLVVGYTLFAPIAYKDDANELTGFDIELAREVVDYLNTKYSTAIVPEFKIITWANKEADLATGTIDLIWNGMTINPTRLTEMQIGLPYLANKQACIIRKADADKYTVIGAFLKNAKNAIVAVENGSAAHDCMDLNRGK